MSYHLCSFAGKFSVQISSGYPDVLAVTFMIFLQANVGMVPEGGSMTVSFHRIFRFSINYLV
jgi:hypothetical protein